MKRFSGYLHVFSLEARSKASSGALASMVSVAILIVPIVSAAAVINIAAADFPEGFLLTENITVKGFRFSPSCHYDVLLAVNVPTPDLGKTYLGIDSSGCGGLFQNPNYLGPGTSGPPASLYIDAGGRPFSLLELEFLRHLDSLISSKGGHFSMDPVFDPNLGVLNSVSWSETFSGDEWTDLQWLVWTYRFDPGVADSGIVNITFQVPEPATLVLLGLSLAGLGWSCRRK